MWFHEIVTREKSIWEVQQLMENKTENCDKIFRKYLRKHHYIDPVIAHGSIWETREWEGDRVERTPYVVLVTCIFSVPRMFLPPICPWPRKHLVMALDIGLYQIMIAVSIVLRPQSSACSFQHLRTERDIFLIQDVVPAMWEICFYGVQTIQSNIIQSLSLLNFKIFQWIK